MHKLMDKVAFDFNDTANTLVLRKRFAEPSAVAVQRFALEGRLDARSTTTALAPVNAALSAGARTILIDLQQVTFLSSSGLRALLLVRRELNERHGALALCGLQPQVEEVFAMTGFAQVFEIFRATDDALASIESRDRA
jgi:anti-anti-sigma factor